MENSYVKLACHAIGLDIDKPYKRHGKYFYKPYRNFHYASKSDAGQWLVMAAAGYAKASKDQCGEIVFSLTRSGMDWLGQKLNITIHDETRD